MTPGKRVVVLGAGLGGLSAAWVLARTGHRVTILEKTGVAGGLAITRKRDGFEYDLGPHNIHTVHEHLLAFLKRHFSASLFEHSPKAKIIKRGRLIGYPLRGLRVITSLEPWKLVPAAVSFLAARVRMFLGRKREPDRSFQGWISNRFGRLLFREYFRPYAEKVWGIRANQIAGYVAEKRVPVISLTELIRSALLGTTAGDKHPEFLDHNFYLRHGIGETVQFFLGELARAGVEIRYGSKVRAIRTDGQRVVSVAVAADGSDAVEELPADYVLSTIPLNELVPMFDAVTPEARAAAEGLDYCATVLLFLRLSRTDVIPTSMLYFSDPAVRFSRVYDVGMYSRAMVPAGKTMLCLEYPCSVGDAVWTAPDAALAEESTEVMVKNGLFARSDLEGFHTEHISHSYPRFRVGFQERVSACFAFLHGYRNVLSYGRQGSFAYLNTDGVMVQGFKAASAVAVADSMDFPCWEWFDTR